MLPWWFYASSRVVVVVVGGFLDVSSLDIPLGSCCRLFLAVTVKRARTLFGRFSNLHLNKNLDLDLLKNPRKKIKIKNALIKPKIKNHLKQTHIETR